MEILLNTDVVVAISFALFIGILIYARVPQMVTGMLDARAAKIRADLDEARHLRDEAQALLASYERKQADMERQADEILVQAREEAKTAAAHAQTELERTVARRVRAAEDQIAAAEAAALASIRDKAVTIAIAAAGDILGRTLTADRRDALTDAAIAETGTRLH